MGDEIILVRTKRGGESALHKGYRYHKQKLIKSNLLWRCVNKKYCPGSIFTNNKRVFKILKTHTCKPNHLENEKIRIFDRHITEIGPVGASLSQVYHSIIDEYKKAGIFVGEDIKMRVKKRLYNLKKSINLFK